MMTDEVTEQPGAIVIPEILLRVCLLRRKGFGWGKGSSVAAVTMSNAMVEPWPCQGPLSPFLALLQAPVLLGPQ